MLEVQTDKSAPLVCMRYRQTSLSNWSLFDITQLHKPPDASDPGGRYVNPNLAVILAHQIKFSKFLIVSTTLSFELFLTHMDKIGRPMGETSTLHMFKTLVVMDVM